MKSPLRHLGALSCLVALVAGAAACQPSFEHLADTKQLSATFACDKTPCNLGGTTLDQRLPISFTQSQLYPVHIEARTGDGVVDATFNGYVRASVRPGTVLSVTGPNTAGRNVQLVNGTADIVVEVVGAYGDTRIWIEDLGYVPADPARVDSKGKPQPPQCADGIDNNLNGKVDFPVDPGCAYANDDTEDGGSFAGATTDQIHYLYPRVADVRGAASGGGATPFPFEQVQIDTQWFGTTAATRAGVVVTRVASDGFYVTDLGDPRGFTSVYAYNYTAPPRMQVCDRLISFGGTASDFYGFTEIGFPTWVLEEWVPVAPMNPDPSQRECLVPEPTVIMPADTTSTPVLLNLEASLVRVQRNPVDLDLAAPKCSVDMDCATECQATPACKAKNPTLACIGGLCVTPQTLHVAGHFGANFPAGPMYTPDADTSNCDFNRNGKVDFTGGPEQACDTVCTADPECAEYVNFTAQNQFRVVLVAAGGAKSTMLANAATSATFDPVGSKGKDIVGFTGTLRYFSGGSQFTIEARCDDDIVADPTDPTTQPASSKKACVHPRTISDTNQF